jgi:photosystem I P700 chlorophyll a apoprotein A1
LNQDVLNGDQGGGFAAIRITSGFMHHLAGLLGLGSLGWAGHQVHVAGTLNKCLDLGLDPLAAPLPHEWIITPERISALYAGFELRNLLALNWPALEALSFLGGANPTTAAVYATDATHHHLAVGVVFIIAGHLYQTQFRIGSPIAGLLSAHRMQFTNSWHAQLSINLAVVGSLSILFAHHGYAMPAYPYIAYDYATQLSLFTHHMWIGGFFITGAGAHAACFMVYDYQPRYSGVIDRVLAHKHAILVHLNWACIFVGMHSFGLYIHNDTMNALGRTSDTFADTAIALQPVFAQWIQHVHLSTFGPAISPAVWSHALFSVNGQVGLMPVRLGTADFMVHHIHAFTIHVTTLILLKGVLFARNSRLIPDKALLGFRFP